MPDYEIIWIFDMDGVLVDSMQFLKRAYYDFLKIQDVKGSEEEFKELSGPSLKEIVQILKDKHDLSGTHAELMEAYYAQMDAAYAEANPLPHAMEVVQELRKKGHRIGIASSASRRFIDLIVKKFKIDVDVIVSGDDVKNSKPHPEIYEIAKQKFDGIARYIAVEDSKKGVQAALDATIETVWLNHHKEEGFSNIVQIHSLEELMPIAEKLQNEYETLSTCNKIEVCIVDKKIELSNEEAQRVENLWNEALKKRELFNGAMFCIDTFEENDGVLTINVFKSEYKLFMAKRKDPSLSYSFTPLAVSGLTRAGEEIIFAKRQNVTQYAGYFELVPSGSISDESVENGKINFIKHIKQELEEETGIKPELVENVQPFCFVMDNKDDVADIGLHIQLKEGTAPKETEEYHSFVSVGQGNLVPFVQKKNNNIIPTSILLLNIWRKQNE